MGEIKIINVLKDDRFEELFDEFKKAKAEEVIFIFPKNSRAAKEEGDFISLANEAQSSGRQVTVMTADQRVNDYAKKYGFKFLSSSASQNKDKDGESDQEEEKLKPEDQTSDEDSNDQEENDKDVTEDNESDDLTEEPEDHEEENDEDEDKDKDEDYLAEEEEATADQASLDENQSESLADFAMARSNPRNMEDIRRLGNPSHLTVKKSKEPKLKIGLKKDKLDNLESIWLKAGEDSRGGSTRSIGKNIWEKLPSFPNSSDNKLWTWAVGGGILLVLAFFYFFLGKAQIVIKPQTQEFNLEETVRISSSYSDIDAVNNRLPGKTLSASAEISKDFPATGQKQVAQKAKGEITIFNNYNSETQTFVATTRFQSSTGLIFRIPRPVTIPGAKLRNGQLTPGSVSVEVLADKPGTDYNIGPNHFTVPGLKSSPKFTGFYAESTKAMAGGSNGFSKVITEKDFNDAKEAISREVLAQASDKLKNEAGTEKVLEVSPVVSSLKATGNIDDAIEGFSIMVQAEAKTIGFKEEDLIKLLKTIVGKNEQMVLRPGTVKLEYKNIQLDPDQKTLSFTVSAKGIMDARIDQKKIINEMSGMKQSDIKSYLESIPEIKSARVILSPFWVKSIPKNKDKVKLDIDL